MMPRPIADLLALWRGLIGHPREVLLNRAHRQWRGAGFIALLSIPSWFGKQPLFLAAVVVLPVLFASFALDLAGTLAHGLWLSGRIWCGIECECCNGYDPGDEDDEPAPDQPDDPHGIARDFETYLRNQTPAR